MKSFFQVSLLILVLNGLVLSFGCGEKSNDHPYQESDVISFDEREYERDLEAIEHAEESLSAVGIIFEKSFRIKDNQVYSTSYSINLVEFMKFVRMNRDISPRDIERAVENFVFEGEGFLQKYKGVAKEDPEVDKEIEEKVSLLRPIASQLN